MYTSNFKANLEEINTTRVWIPSTSFIVLGVSCKEEDSIHLDQADQNAVPFVKRKGGGGTVYLDSGCIIIDFLVSDHYDSVARAMEDCLEKVCLGIQKFLITDTVTINKENFDLRIGNKKIAGSSLYKNKSKIFISVSLLHSNQTISEIERYLKIPLKQPSYRENRNHSSFLTSFDRHSKHSIESTKNDLLLSLEKFYTISLQRIG